MEKDLAARFYIMGVVLGCFMGMVLGIALTELLSDTPEEIINDYFNGKYKVDTCYYICNKDTTITYKVIKS